MVLSEKEIRTCASDPAAPLIVPFSEDRLRGASYDVSMTDVVITQQKIGRVVDPSDGGDMGSMYDVRVVDDSGYLLSPGEYVQVKLREKLILPPHLAAHLRPRSRFTRCGVLMADQHYGPAYEGGLSVGLYNAGANPVLLRPGLIVAQLVFEQLTSIPSGAKLRSRPAGQ